MNGTSYVDFSPLLPVS